MALARVVTFDGVTQERMEAMRGEMESGSPPEGMPPAELLVLHDPQAEKSLVVLVLDSEEDYEQAHRILDAMPAPETPGQRTSVQKYEVAVRMKP